MSRHKQRNNAKLFACGLPLGHIHDSGCSKEEVNRIRSKCHAIIADSIGKEHKKNEIYLASLFMRIGDDYIWGGSKDILVANHIPFSVHANGGYVIAENWFSVLREALL